MWEGRRRLPVIAASCCRVEGETRFRNEHFQAARLLVRSESTPVVELWDILRVIMCDLVHPMILLLGTHAVQLGKISTFAQYKAEYLVIKI